MGQDVLSVGLEGMKGHIVRVEANVRSDKDQFVIVGLPDASIKESKERVLSCLHALTSLGTWTPHNSDTNQTTMCLNKIRNPLTREFGLEDFLLLE